MPRDRIPSDKILKVGLIGASTIADHNHLPVLGAIPGLAAEWVWDIDQDRAGDVARRHRITALREQTELVANPVDLLLITIPYGARDTAYSIARDMGAAVLVEKPFARTLARHHENSRGFEPHRASVGLQRRYHEAVELARHLVEAEMFGALTGVVCHYGGIGHRLGGGYAADFGLAGGGLLFNLAIHDLDLALYTTNAHRLEVDRARMEFEAGLDIHADADVTLTLADGRDIPLELRATSLERTDRAIRLDFPTLSVFLRIYRGDGVLVARGHNAGADLKIEALGVGGHDGSVGARTTNQMLGRMWSDVRDGLATGVEPRVAAARTVLVSDLIGRLYTKAGAPAHPLDKA